MNWRKHVTTWYFVRNSLKTVSGDHGWQIWKSLRVNPLLWLEKLSNEMIVVIPALKNNGDENKPDKNTIVEQISSASVIVNGDLKIQKRMKFYNVLWKDYSTLYSIIGYHNQYLINNYIFCRGQSDVPQSSFNKKYLFYLKKNQENVLVFPDIFKQWKVSNVTVIINLFSVCIFYIFLSVDIVKE